jgi:protein phosphatase
MSSAWVSHIGHRRSDQEDRAAAGKNFVVIADGVGSVPGGGEAAQVAVGHFSARITGARSESDIVATFQETHDLIVRLADQGVLPPGCATTLTAAIHIGDTLMIANIGDSPGWLLDQDGPRNVVRLHRRWDPFRQSFVLLSALGTGDFTAPTVTAVSLTSAKRVVLASDGIITDPADPEPPQILTLALDGDTTEVVHRIADAVLQGPALDNLTIAVIDIGPAGPG